MTALGFCAKNTPMKTTTHFGSGAAPLVAASVRVVGFFSLIALLLPMQLFYNARKLDEPFFVAQLFYRLLLKVLGFRVRVHGVMTASVKRGAPVLFVSNHTSYLDIPVLGALIPAAFVAKAEVRDWPMIGFLSAVQNTVFIERRSSRVSTQRNYLRERLAAGQSLILFPEGTSTDGLTVLPFKSSLFSIVEDEKDDLAISVQPVSIACTELDGLPITRSWRPFYAWYGDMTLISHLWNVFKFGHFTIDVTFHPPITAQDFPDRKVMALYCQQQVAKGVEQSLAGRGLSISDTPRLSPPARDNLATARP